MGKFILKILLIGVLSGVIITVCRRYIPAEKAYVTNITKEEEDLQICGKASKIVHRIVCDRTINKETEVQIPIELGSDDWDQVTEYGYYLVGGWTRVSSYILIIDILLVMISFISYFRDRY